MTKRLILMRHAKSSWDDPTLEDHQRVLNGRGRNSADAMGDWLRARKYKPDQALVSNAMRTRETFGRLGFICDTNIIRTLYHASPPAMMKVLKGAIGDTVLMIGHNPGIAEFAEELVATPPNHSRFYDYPTCATTVMDFDIADWSALKPNSGEVREFIIPREITA